MVCFCSFCLINFMYDTHTHTHARTDAHIHTLWYQVNNWWPLPCYVHLYGKCMDDILTICHDTEKKEAFQHSQGGTMLCQDIANTCNYFPTLILSVLAPCSTDFIFSPCTAWRDGNWTLGHCWHLESIHNLQNFSSHGKLCKSALCPVWCGSYTESDHTTKSTQTIADNFT